jgi:hypothetical protein
MPSFTDYLKTFPVQPLLPLAHSTSFLHFRDILSSHVLTPTPCTVFKDEELLYLFYGRPAYRVSRGVLGSPQLRHLPVCFLLQPDAITTPKRVYPFDSGAFMSNLFKNFLTGLDLDNFALLDDFPKTLQRLISAFYGSNLNYYYGKMDGPASGSPLDIEVNAYLAMLRDTGVAFASESTSSDDRRYTIEIQADSSIQLAAEDAADANGNMVVRNRVVAVALPLPALGEDEIMEPVTKIWKAEPITYPTYGFAKPEEYHSVIRDKIAEFLIKRGVLR